MIKSLSITYFIVCVFELFPQVHLVSVNHLTVCETLMVRIAACIGHPI